MRATQMRLRPWTELRPDHCVRASARPSGALTAVPRMQKGTGSGHGVQHRQVPRQPRHVLRHWSSHVLSSSGVGRHTQKLERAWGGANADRLTRSPTLAPPRQQRTVRCPSVQGFHSKTQGPRLARNNFFSAVQGRKVNVSPGPQWHGQGQGWGGLVMAWEHDWGAFTSRRWGGIFFISWPPFPPPSRTAL